MWSKDSFTNILAMLHFLLTGITVNQSVCHLKTLSSSYIILLVRKALPHCLREELTTVLFLEYAVQHLQSFFFLSLLVCCGTENHRGITWGLNSWTFFRLNPVLISSQYLREPNEDSCGLSLTFDKLKEDRAF